MFGRAWKGAAVVGACLVLNGCATMYVRGNKLRVVETQGDEKVPLRVINFDNATSSLRIFEGDAELEILAVPDHVIANNFRSYLNRETARASCTAPCRYSWDDVSEFGPGLWLDSRRPHTLRFVRNGQEAVVTIKSSFRPKWIFANWVWFAFAPVGWVVDGATGSWNEYPRLDIDHLFQEARGADRGGSRE
jgi:hypothetical protein